MVNLLWKFLYNDFLKIFDIIGNLKKVDTLTCFTGKIAKVGAKVYVKVATFHTGLLPCTSNVVMKYRIIAK